MHADTVVGMREVANGGPRLAADPAVRSDVRTAGASRMYGPALWI